MRMSAADRIISLESSLAEMSAKVVKLEGDVAMHKSFYNSQSVTLAEANKTLELVEAVLDAIPGVLPRQKVGDDAWEKNPLAVRLVSAILALKGQ